MEGVIGLSIPILALMIPFFAIWTKHKERIAKATVNVTAEQTAERAAQYASQITALEDRVRVLERIVTDKGYDVATQIEALRDQRRVDDGAGVTLDFAGKERV